MSSHLDDEYNQLYQDLVKLYPKIPQLSAKKCDSMISRIIKKVDEIYPRYDKHTLSELIEILEEYVEPIVLKYLYELKTEAEKKEKLE